MKTQRTMSLMLILLILGVGWVAWFAGCDKDDKSSESDDSDTGKEDDDNNIAPGWPPGCVGQEGEGKMHDPVILDSYLLVNGVIAEQPATIHLDDTFVLAVEYEDEDCNLEGGRLIMNTTTWGGFMDDVNDEYRLDDIGCSSAETGEPYYQELEPSGFQFDQQQYPLYFTLQDRCYLLAEKQFIEFTVVP